MIYMVENGFGDPTREAAWNEWYTGHMTHAFRKVPGWRTGQRFRALPPCQPKYRAMYTVDSADVFTSPEYKTTTGGRFPPEWRACIGDVRRNLADGDRTGGIRTRRPRRHGDGPLPAGEGRRCPGLRPYPG